MKTIRLLSAIAVALILCTSANAQYSAGTLTRKVAPPPAPPQQPARPAAPAARPVAPATVQPARPADPDKERAQKEETLRKTVAFQKDRAEKGSPTAQYDLALRYLNGEGVEKDPALARKWLQESAKQDYKQAQKKLAELDAAAAAATKK